MFLRKIKDFDAVGGPMIKPSFSYRRLLFACSLLLVIFFFESGCRGNKAKNSDPKSLKTINKAALLNLVEDLAKLAGSKHQTYEQVKAIAETYGSVYKINFQGVTKENDWFYSKPGIVELASKHYLNISTSSDTTYEISKRFDFILHVPKSLRTSLSFEDFKPRFDRFETHDMHTKIPEEVAIFHWTDRANVEIDVFKNWEPSEPSADYPEASNRPFISSIRIHQPYLSN